MGGIRIFGFLQGFGKSAKQKRAEESQRRAKEEDLELYSGMQVEVTSEDGRMFLTATLLDLRGDRAQLEPRSEGNLLAGTEEPVPVTLRGYSSLEGKAVVLEGTIRPNPNGLWEAEHLVLVKRGNDRAFFRVDTNIDAGVTPMGSFSSKEEPCKVLNISVGGIFVSSKLRHNVGDKFILQVKLLPELEPSLMFCQVLRILERRADYFEYGCQFLRLNSADEERILQIIFDLQRKRR
ncbi:MAG: PilZ domain-containing protein [Lawsonibacter sp.]|nr:PilZ domain-containing protein [Lawsonibacter sp.]